MSLFKLPDLGEGLPDAEIHEWFVKEGQHVKVDEPLVSMETAKAVVDVPSPFDGVILKLHGQPGDIIKTGAPLVEFVTEKLATQDKGTVVGHLEESHESLEESFIIGSQTSKRIKVAPAVRFLAKKLKVDLDEVIGTGEHGVITRLDVEQKAQSQQQIPEGFEPLKGVRRAMLQSMRQSHEEVVPVSIYDVANISAWYKSTDITVKLIKAIVDAVKKEPSLNAWFNPLHSARKCFDTVNIGLAIDSDEGLFVPVIENAGALSDALLREKINTYKKEVQERSIHPDHLKGATITLSNFGKFAGRYASPIIVPPQVAIIAVGRIYDDVVAHNGQIEIHPQMPLSLSFDHRAITGGEATRFLGEMINSLQKP
jgi:2-oxoisovalerate dehydrogenase E2 component (dihydrolipoyl transacylase)